jgi:hypothetical protein
MPVYYYDVRPPSRSQRFWRWLWRAVKGVAKVLGIVLFFAACVGLGVAAGWLAGATEEAKADAERARQHNT